MIDKFDSCSSSKEADVEKQIEFDTQTIECKKLVRQLARQASSDLEVGPILDALYDMPISVLFRAAWEGLSGDRMDITRKGATNDTFSKPSDKEVRYRMSLLPEEEQVSAEVVAREWLSSHP
jgi:hypothetical protein